MTIVPTFRVRCDDCSAVLYDDLLGDEYPTAEDAEAARREAGWGDGFGRTACPNHHRTLPAAGGVA
jgi:hypothetical protein